VAVVAHCCENWETGGSIPSLGKIFDLWIYYLLSHLFIFKKNQLTLGHNFQSNKLLYCPHHNQFLTQAIFFFFVSTGLVKKCILIFRQFLPPHLLAKSNTCCCQRSDVELHKQYLAPMEHLNV